MNLLIGLAMLASTDTVPETINVPVEIFPKTDTVKVNRIIYDSSGFVKTCKGYAIRKIKVTADGTPVKTESVRIFGPKGEIKEENIIAAN